MRPIPYDPLDEVFIRDAVSVHLEQLSDGCYWIGVERKNGEVDHIRIFSVSARAKLNAIHEADA